MDMRTTISDIIQRGRDKDHASETIAEAVLNAMREPDEGMIEAGAGVIPCAQGVEEGPLNTDAARACWQEMLTAARKPSPPEEK